MEKPSISQFVEGVCGNSINTLDGEPLYIEYLDRVNRLFFDLLVQPPLQSSGPVVFVGLAHSAFLAASQLATGGQLPPSYMAGRGCLEAAIYGWWVTHRPELKAIWSSRDESKEAKEKVKRSFKIGDIRRALREENAAIENQFAVGYETTIDLGAHPNSLALWTNLWPIDDDGSHYFAYVNFETVALRQALITAAHCGTTALTIFLYTYEPQLKDTEFPTRIHALLRDFGALVPESSDEA